MAADTQQGSAGTTACAHTDSASVVMDARRVWRIQKLKYLAMWFLFIVGPIVALFVVHHFFAEPPKDPIRVSTWTEAIFFSVLRAPTSVMDMLFYGAMGLCMLLGLGNSIRTLLRLTFGPPTGGKTPERTVDSFFGAALIAQGSINMGSVRADSVFYLTADALADIGGWPGFRSYWSDVNQSVLTRLRELCAGSNVNLNETRFGRPKTRIVQEDPDRCTASVEVPFQAIYAGVNNQKAVLGTWDFRSECRLYKVRARWFLSSARSELTHHTHPPSPPAQLRTVRPQQRMRLKRESQHSAATPSAGTAGVAGDNEPEK